MGRTMQISSPVRAVGRRDHVIGTSMSSNYRAHELRASTPSQEDYNLDNPGVESISKVMSYRSAAGETDFHDAEMDFSPSQWKEIKEIYADTHSPEFEQMPPPQPMSPNTYLDRHTESLLTPARTPNPSGQLNQIGQRIVEVPFSRGMKSPGRGNYAAPPSSSPDEFSYTRTPTASGANSPQHSGMWTSPRHRKNPPAPEMPSPSRLKRFSWLTPTRSKRRGPDSTSPDYSIASQQMRDPPESSVPSSPARSIKSGAQPKLHPPVGSVSPAMSHVGKDGKSAAKPWKHLSRSISPLFGRGRKSDHSLSGALKTISRDLGASFQGSRRRAQNNGSVARATANAQNWSGESAIVAPDLEKDTSASEVGFSSELAHNGGLKGTKNGVGNGNGAGLFNILSWGKKKGSGGSGTKINELFQVVEQGSVKLDSNSFKVMEYTIKTLHFKLEQAKKNELATAEEFKALQAAMDAAEGKCLQWQQRCQELESQLGLQRTETKDVELDYEIAKHRRDNAVAAAATPSKAHRFTTIDVTPPMFQKAFEDSKLCVKRLASALCLHIRASGESATQVITSLLAQQKDSSPKLVSKMPRSVIVLYFESFLNTILYESFENISFEPSGATPIYDPDQLRQSCCKEFHELKKQDWSTIEKSLDGKPQGVMTIVNPTFHRFFVIRMELILSQLTKAADHETSIALLTAFFNAFKSVWLLHHLAFANELPVTIFRVSPRAVFDPRFMEQVTTYEEEAVRSKVSVMVNPGFIVNRQTIKCQVFCSSKYQ